MNSRPTNGRTRDDAQEPVKGAHPEHLRPPPRRRAACVVGMALVLFLLGGRGLERLPALRHGRESLRGHAGVSGLPDNGSVARVLAEATGRWRPARSLLSVSAEEIPSSVVLDRASIEASQLPVLSFVADPDHLWDETYGILANPTRTGRQWERPVWVSLWEHGELRLGARAGLRVHGDSSRYVEGKQSLRLYFRGSYGSSPEDASALLGTDIAPASVVVLRDAEPDGLYPDVFAFDIARRIGSVAPAFRPVRVFRNGQELGVLVLTERVMADGWGLTRYGDANFHMYVYKGESSRPSVRAYDEMEAWLLEGDDLSLAEAAERVDVENLTRHLLALMFCFTTDWAQGAMVQERDDPAARWFWVHWDMDQSFTRRGTVPGPPWEQPVMELLTLEADIETLESHGIVTDERHRRRHHGDPRRLLFVRLLRDPDYRELFLRITAEVLNHRLTPEFFDALLARHAPLGGSGGRFGGVNLERYFSERPEVLRREIAGALETGAPIEVRVRAPIGQRFRVDGREKRGDWTGVYFPGQTVRLESPEGVWQLEGTPSGGRELVLAPVSDVEVRLVREGSLGRGE